MVRDLRRRFQELAEARANRQRELSLIRFERDDLDNARLQPNELPTLAKERETLIHAQSLAQFTGTVAARLADDDGAVDGVIARLLKDAQRWAGLDPQLQDIAKRLEALRPEIQDLAETCRDLAERFEADPARLEEVEQRVALLKKLQARYGKTPDELIAYRATLDAKESALQKQEDDLAAIDASAEIGLGRLAQGRERAQRGPREGRQEARGRSPEATGRPPDEAGPARCGDRSHAAPR